MIDGERFAEAVSAYQHVIQFDPRCRDAHGQLGFALANLQRFDEAWCARRQALQLCPSDPRGYERLGVSLLLGHDVSAAEACFRKALLCDPASAAAWNGLGTSLQALGQLSESRECFRRAVEIEPEKAFFHKSVADATRQIAAPATIRHLRGLLDRDDMLESNRVDAGFALGKMLDDAARYDEAFAPILIG